VSIPYLYYEKGSLGEITHKKKTRLPVGHHSGESSGKSRAEGREIGWVHVGLRGVRRACAKRLNHRWGGGDKVGDDPS